MKKSTILVAMFATAVAFGADEPTEERVFNITDYPAVHAIREEFKEFNLKTDEYNKQRMFWLSKSEEEKDAYLAGLVQIAQDWNGKHVPFYKPEIWFPGFFDADKIHAADEALAEAGCAQKTHGFLWNLFNGGICTYYTMPKIQDAWYNSTNAPVQKEDMRVYYTVYHRYPTFKDIPFEAKINLAAFEMCRGQINVESGYIKSIFNRLPIYLKRKLREQGKTFFVDEETGANPVQDAVDEFIAAFNAPKLAGLKELVAKWDPDYEWIDLPDYWLTDEKLDSLKERVYYGEVDFGGTTKNKLMNNLGLDKFNEFVEWYNGGSKQ